MKYVDLKSSLKIKVENAYAIYGEDRYLCYDALNKIEAAAAITMRDMNYVTLDGETTSATEIVNSANVYPFGDAYRLVLVKDFAPKDKKGERTIISEYLKTPMPTTILVFFSPQNAEFLGTMSDITPVNCDKIEPKFISAFIKNFLAKNQISSNEAAIEKLINYCGSDMSRINSELEKLSSYVAESKVLTEKIIEDFVVEDKEFEVFELAEFLARGDAESAFELMDSFMVKPGSAFTLISPLFNNYRRALFVAINKDKSAAELASLLGIKEYAVKMLSKQVAIFSPKKLKKIVDMIGEYDKKIKVGEMKELSAIKLIASNILNIRGNNV